MTREEAIHDIEECVLPHVGGISLRMAIDDMKEMDRLSKAEPVLIEPERPHGECNQCRYYDGVRGVQGHAPCSFWGIGGVLSSDYCSRFEKEGDKE